MQKYFVGLLAVVIAVSAVAFKTAPTSKKFVDHYFRYAGAAGSEANPANWQYIGETNTESCSNDDDKSCVIRVDPAVVSTSGATTIIDPSLLSSQYSTSTLPMTAGVGAFQIPDVSAKPGLFTQVRNTLVP